MSHIAIRNIYDNVATILGEFPECQAWDKKGNLITLDDDLIEKEIIRLDELRTVNQYRQERAKEYPSIGDQLDALFHAGVFPPEMAAKIQAVKDKYPKGS